MLLLKDTIQYCRYGLLLMVMIWITPAYAQEPSEIDSTDKLVVKFAETRSVDLSSDDPVQLFYGNVKLYKDSIFMFCDTARVTGNHLRARGNVIIIQNDTIQVFADSLYYNGDSLKAYLYHDVVLKNGDKSLYSDILVYDTERKVASYQDTAIMTQEFNTLQSVRGYYDVNNDQAFFYQDVYIEGQDMRMRADSMSYLTDEQKAIFMGPTRIQQTQRDIYCESGFYDMDDEVALFKQNAQYQEPDSEANAQSILYTKQTGDIILTGDAYYRNKTDIGEGQMISYNEISETAELKGNASFRNEKSEVVGEHIIYDKKTESFKVKGKSVISDPPYIIEAESIDYDKSSGTAYADFDVVWQDTSAQLTIICDHLQYQEEIGKVLATNDNGKPVMQNISEGDTLYLAAEILQSYEVYTTDTLGRVDTTNYLIADNEVQILKSNLQGICDSLVYQDRDSLFLLLDDPVVWSDSSQIIGDTIEIYLAHDDIDRMEVYPNAFLANSADLIYFNQISGKHITSYFTDGELSTMDVIGNARSLYYMLDEFDAYIGVNSTECSKIRFTFADRQIKGIKFYTNPASKILPMRTTDHDAIQLEGFDWRYDERPQSIYDLNTNLTKDQILKAPATSEVLQSGTVKDKKPESRVISETLKSKPEKDQKQ